MAAKESAKKCAVSSEFLFCWRNLLLTVIISVDSQARKWSWARFPPLSRSEAGNRACQPSTSIPGSSRFPSEKNPGDEVGQPYTISFKNRRFDGKLARKTLCSWYTRLFIGWQVRRPFVMFLDIKSLTDFLKRENTERIIYFFLLTQARFPFKKIKAWVFYLIPQKQEGVV